MTSYQKQEFAIEMAFRNLLEEGKKRGLDIPPVMGLVYLPDTTVSEKFKEVCRSVFQCLGVEIPDGA